MPPPDHVGPEPGFTERVAAVFSNRWLMLLLIAFGVMALVVSVVGFSGAYFTSRSTSPGNTFTAAEIRLSITKTGQVLDGAGYYPGLTRTGTQTVTNTGHSAAITLSVNGLASSPLANVLTVKVSQIDPVEGSVYNGPLSGLGTADLGTYTTGEHRTYNVTVSWPASESDPALQGAQIAFSFGWRATSVP